DLSTLDESRRPTSEPDPEVHAETDRAVRLAEAVVLEPDGQHELDEVVVTAPREALVQERREPPRRAAHVEGQAQARRPPCSHAAEHAGMDRERHPERSVTLGAE